MIYDEMIANNYHLYQKLELFENLIVISYC
jgi:hypothetical protein